MLRSLLVSSLLSLVGCATLEPSRALVTAADHQRLSIDPQLVAPWEDGRRTDGSAGTYEWWYLDAHLDDGSTLVVVFSDKPITDVQGPVRPSVHVNWDRADGTKFARVIEVPVEQFTASTKRCEVTLGANVFEGDLHTYHLKVDDAAVHLDLTLVSESLPWRPGGGLAFGPHDERSFAWLPAVPQGRVSGTLTADGRTVALSGSGYHDHNWGNAALQSLIHDWYWARAQVGPYTVIASDIITEERYGFRAWPVFFLARGTQLLAQGGETVHFTASPPTVDEVTGKPVSDRLVWDWSEGKERYRVTFQRRKNLVRGLLTDGLPPFTRFLAKLAGLDPAYLRFTGQVTVEQLEGETVTAKETNDAAVWELMYLGHAR